jgi:CDP-diglyceride synthetase
MIQRIQTLFLLLGAISAGFLSMNLLGIWEHFAFATAALISLIIIFMYKKRKLQISLSTWLVIPLYITGIAIILFFSKGHYDESKDMTTLSISFFVGLVSTILAIFSIRKDEKTVQESNRLR